MPIVIFSYRGPGEDWFAQLQLILSIKGVSQTFEYEVLYVRWLTEEQDTAADSVHIKMPWLSWTKLSGGRPSFDILPLACVDGPAYIMKDPRECRSGNDHFFYNKYVCE